NVKFIILAIRLETVHVDHGNGNNTAMATKTWAGNVSGTWGNGNNWSPTGLPAAADDVALVGPATISGNGVSASISVYGSVIIGGAYATGALTIGTQSNDASLTLSSGG